MCSFKLPEQAIQHNIQRDYGSYREHQITLVQDILKHFEKKEQESSSLTSCLPCPVGPCRSKAAFITCRAAGDEPESSNVAPWISMITKTIN